MRSANLAFDEFRHEGSTIRLERRSIRRRFALRFGDGKADERDDDLRSEYVRRAFNSPFRPFILASTSIGQDRMARSGRPRPIACAPHIARPC